MDAITKQSKPKDLTISKEFRPTPHMLIWLDTAMKLMTDNISEIERESHISAQIWYMWLKKDSFRTWFKTEWDRRISGEAWKLDVIGFKNGKRDFKYWESMQKRVGNLKDDKGDTNINVMTGLQIVTGEK